MSKFKIKVARIETVAGTEDGTQVRITFQIDRGLLTFQVPIFLSIRDFDERNGSSSSKYFTSNVR